MSFPSYELVPTTQPYSKGSLQRIEGLISPSSTNNKTKRVTIHKEYAEWLDIYSLNTKSNIEQVVRLNRIPWYNYLGMI